MNFTLDQALANGLTLKPENVGETITGTITGTEVKQVIEYGGTKPQTWSDGSPQLQILIRLTTADGEGTVYVKNWGKQRAALLSAIKNGGFETAGTALAPGNRFSVTFVGEEPNEKNPRLNPAKIYRYEIRAGANPQVTQALDNSQFDNEPPAGEPAQVDIPALIKAGMSDEQISGMTGIPADTIAFIRQQA